MAQNLVYLGVRDFVLVDDDETEESGLTRQNTAMAADVETPKVFLARRLIKSMAPVGTSDILFDLCSFRLLNSCVPACHFMHTSRHQMLH